MQTNTLTERSKVFNDSVHGHIEFHPLLVKLIDTPQFQRLRYISQVSTCYFVFPTAAHSRFEHSIGVCHLAGQLARELQRKQPELNISLADVLCVEIAALCHDLGHGPFSHTWELFMKRIDSSTKWKHEEMSVKMLQYLIEDNDLEKHFVASGITATYMNYVIQQIAGDLSSRNKWRWNDGGQDRSFLYDIVSNKWTEMDVDKFDYLERDCQQLGMKNTFNQERIVKFSRVIDINGVKHICVQDKEDLDVYNMFQQRWTLHRKCYQHRVNHCIEEMLLDALVLANSELPLYDGDGVKYTLYEASQRCDRFVRLSDSVLQMILYPPLPSPSCDLRLASSIAHRILKRQLYPIVGQTSPRVHESKVNERRNPLYNKSHVSPHTDAPYKQADTDKISGEIMELADEDLKKDIVVRISQVDFGKKDKNPLENMYFYCKYEPDKARMILPAHVSLMLPQVFQEFIVRCFSRSQDPSVLSRMRIVFETWCAKENFHTPKQKSWPAHATPKRKNELNGANGNSVKRNLSFNENGEGSGNGEINGSQ